jgi:hypothetical protein
MRDIDKIIDGLKAEIPGVHIAQLQVHHPGADDDGLWFIDIPGRPETVQIESSNGECPFLIDSDCGDERFQGYIVWRRSFQRLGDSSPSLLRLFRSTRLLSPSTALT